MIGVDAPSSTITSPPRHRKSNWRRRYPAVELRGMLRAAALVSWFLGRPTNTLHYLTA